MKDPEALFRRISILSFGFVTLPFIWITQSYLLFHLIVELICVFIALAMYYIATRTYRFSRNDLLLFIGVGFFYIALLDIGHAFAYKGMNLIAGADTNIATQLWISSRVLEISVLFAVTFPRCREFSGIKLHMLFSGIALVLAGSIALGIFPACYIEGSGLTPFKIGAEYFIILLGAITFIRFRKLRAESKGKIFGVLGWAVLVMIAAEFCFTLYRDVYGVLNGLGHMFKALSYGLIWVFVIQEGLNRPYDSIFRMVYEKSVRDPLTGLFNRHGLEEMSRNRFDKSKRFPGTFTLMMMDLDNFKTINDDYGHIEGDRALNEFGKILRVCFREYDVISRFGGDEFTVFIDGGPEFWPVIEKRLETAIASWKKGNPMRGKLGVTWGMALRKSGADTDLASLIAEADAAMLDAKARKHAAG